MRFGHRPTHSRDMNDYNSETGRGPLRRQHDGRMLAGVAGGLARYLGVDVTIVRVFFVAATLLGGAGVPVYLACLLLIPEEGSDTCLAAEFLDSIKSR